MMTEKPAFDRVHILIADHDTMMAEMLERVLRELGIVNIIQAKSGNEALQIANLREIDILFTEWDMSPLDGVNLIKALRDSEIPKLRMMPVVMLTARSTVQDTRRARDAGVTEFLVKPYTPETLFNRLEHIIDFPRDFIISEHYIGPDRRRNKNTIGEDRRRSIPQPYTDMPKKLPADGAPIRILPKRDLAEKFNLDTRLRDLITPQMLEDAQQAIESFREASLQWVAEDMAGLEQAADALSHDKAPEASMKEVQEYLLAIKSRAGTFSYKLAAQVAFDLYRFLRQDFQPGNDRHKLIVIKHVEVIKVLLAQRIIGEGGRSEHTLLEGLKILMRELNRPESQEKMAVQ